MSPPAPVTAPARSRPSVVTGWVLVGGAAVAIAALAVGTTLSTTIYGVPLALSFLLVAVQSSAIPLAIPRPLVAAIASTVSVIALALAQAASGHAAWPWAVLTIITHSIVLVLVGLQARSRIAVLAWLVAVVGTLAVTVFMLRLTDAHTINIIIAMSVTGVAAAGGIVWREWRSIRVQLIRERSVSAEEHERRVLAEEKARIARELHDVVAHSMSIINVQASSALYRHPGLSDSVAAEFDEIATAARGAIVELRGVLGVLREEGHAPELQPQPGLAEIPSLVQSAVASGVQIQLELDPQLSADLLTDAGGLAAYRVVQEAISNAVRHSPGAGIRVMVVRGAGIVRITVENTPSDLPTETSGGGHGLLGMRERVLAVGGELSTGHTGGGKYMVVARIPFRGVTP